MLYVIDVFLILLIIYGAFRGWKYGGISSAINLIGTILIFVLAYYLKNPISVFFYENMPFFSFSGIFSGITSLNILLYEAIAYVVAMIILTVIVAIIVKVSHLLDKIVNMTLLLALPSKILGLILGALQYYVIAFFVLFVLIQIPFTSRYISESELTKGIVQNTPGLSQVTSQLYNSYNEVYDICIKYDNHDNKQAGDYEALDVLMKYEVITPKSVQKLTEKGKLKIDNSDQLVKKYSK